MYNAYDHYNVREDNFFQIFEKILSTFNVNFIQQDITSTYHYRYFSNYLFFDKNGLKSQTLIVENNYTCLSYLEDFKNYYSQCYTPYEKTCKRVHFFSEKIGKKVFENMILNGEKNQYKKFWQSYLGCIVIKPLPKGIIGVTYLKTYDGDEERNRKYTAVNKYQINLFGTTCELTTLPYIEQDGVVGTCASSALWMAFQKTAELFNTQKPSLSEVTLLAGDDLDNTGKIFPSKGLEFSQVCKAIFNNGLISELRQIQVIDKEEKDNLFYKLFDEIPTPRCPEIRHIYDKGIEISNEAKSEQILPSYDFRWLKGFIYAYLKTEIPILMGIDIEDFGAHLIALNGYRLNFEVSEERKKNIEYNSDYVSKFYAHDDQTGPFSRLKFQKDEDLLLTSWWNKNINFENIKSLEDIWDFYENDDNYKKALPLCIIVPLDRKIKVTYDDILDKVVILKLLFKHYLKVDFFWDIYLTKSNKYKQELKKENLYGENKKKIKSVFLKSLPQYIWVVKAYNKEVFVFDFIFDSIEINPSGQPYSSNIYNLTFEGFINKEIQLKRLFENDLKKTVYRILVERGKKILHLLSSDKNEIYAEIKKIANELHEIDNSI